MAIESRQLSRTKCRKLNMKFVYLIVAIVTVVSLLCGILVGRNSAERSVDTKPVNVTQSHGEYYDVPLSHKLQQHIQEVCSDTGVPESLVLAIIEEGSGFNAEIVTDTNDYGLMLINSINANQLSKNYRVTDIRDPYQNVYCGIHIIASYLKEYKDYNQALMAYSMGEYGAKKAWKNGITSTRYTEKVLKVMNEYEEFANE